jgi:hypothetical protein
VRTPIVASTQARALATRIYHDKRKANLKLQIFDPVTVYVSQNQNDLVSGLNVAGNPIRGLQLQQGIYDFLGINGELWVICNQSIDVEVLWWLV